MATGVMDNFGDSNRMTEADTRLRWVNERPEDKEMNIKTLSGKMPIAKSGRQTHIHLPPKHSPLKCKPYRRSIAKPLSQENRLKILF